MKTLKKYTFILLAAFLTTFGMASCSDEPEPPEPEEPTHRTLIIYMAADNSLLSASRENLKDIKTAVSKGALQGGRIILFYDYSATEAPYLAEITEETGDFVKLKEYDGQVSCLDRDRMNEVIKDAMRAAPAEEYGLILWSHGTGWINESDSRSSSASSRAASDGLINPYSFGHDINPVSTKMSITSLASALEDFHFKFIYFDCCFMATIETIYELRKTADYIIGSPTELPVEGMPYLTNIPQMMAKELQPATIAKNTLDYYLSGQASYPWCTITAIDTSAAEDVAAATKAIMETGALNAANYVPLPYYRSSVPSYTWDFADIINNLNVDDDAKNLWKRPWQRLIIYYGHTDICYFVPMEGTAGLGSFYYSDNTVQWAKEYGYDSLSWWRDVVSFNPSINL